MCLIEMEESGALLGHLGLHARHPQDLLAGSDDFHGQLFQGRSIVAVVEIEQEELSNRKGLAVLLGEAEATFTDIANTGKLIGLPRDADEKKRGKAFARVVPAFHSNGEAKKIDQWLMAVFTEQGMGGRKPCWQGSRTSGC